MHQEYSFCWYPDVCNKKWAISFTYENNAVCKRKRPSNGPALSVVIFLITVTTEELPEEPD